MARAKKRIRVTNSLLAEVGEWEAFINSIPGRTFDAVDLAEDDDGNTVIVSGYGSIHGGQAKEYTREDKAEMQTYAGAVAGDVAQMKAG